MENIYYISDGGIATSLSFLLLLALLNINDSDELIKAKINIIAKYIESFVVKRSINYKKFASSSIRYIMYILVKEIINKPIELSIKILTSKLESMPEAFEIKHILVDKYERHKNEFD